MSFAFQIYDSAVGPLFLVSKDESLYAVLYKRGWLDFTKKLPNIREEETPVIAEARKQLDEYFAGKRQSFDLPYELQGTAFQKRVWTALADIPFGKTRSYKEQALSINSPGAVRAVGSTNGKNLLSIILPCHRVIGADGSLTGYGGGLAAKQFLLKLENSPPLQSEF